MSTSTTISGNEFGGPFAQSGQGRVSRGKVTPYGATETRDGINFAIFSKNATKAFLVIFPPQGEQPLTEIALSPVTNRTGHVWHVLVRDLPEGFRYGWRFDGPRNAITGNRFDPSLILIDPYAKSLTGGQQWGESGFFETRAPSGSERIINHRLGQLESAGFDWGDDAPPLIPLKDTIIYELHVRSYTRHPSSGVAHPGTYLGLIEKIPYIKELGVTAVELMPVFEFDENEHRRHHPVTGALLRNLWGYSPINFFAPKAGFAASGPQNGQVNEFKEMVRQFHRHGLEVFIDVVFNHTGEGDERGPTVSFRGIDNAIYYLVDPKGAYLNFSGCGNTINCNHPAVRKILIDSLRYWVAEMHVDGFRFDLASVLGRGADGDVLEDPPLLERIALDPVLADTKIIAEAWDAAGLYQVGTFPAFGRWAEWNGIFRDQVRLFWKGAPNMVGSLAARLCGSEDIYRPSKRKPWHSVNFVTSHDGFTLLDLVSYEHKHNEDNGEANRDGDNNNHSCNHGVEGPTTDPLIRLRRLVHAKNLLVTLLLSQGVPMILAGDEFIRTQRGNNNPYCQDNEISWINWADAGRQEEMIRFTRLLIQFRKKHPSLRRAEFFGKGSAAISWHGERERRPEWSAEVRWLAYFLHGDQVPGGDDDLFVMINGSDQWRHFAVPAARGEWRRLIDTAKPSPEDFFAEPSQAPSVGHRHHRYGVHPMSVTVLVAPR